MNALDELLHSDKVLRRGGHFRCGPYAHSDGYLDMATVFANPGIVDAAGKELAHRARMATTRAISAVAGPYLRGALLAMATAKYLVSITGDPVTLYARHGNASEPLFVLDPEYRALAAGRQVLVVDDVLTTGNSALATAMEVRRAGGEVVAVAAIVNRGGVKHDRLRVPTLITLIDMPLEAWSTDRCPLCEEGVLLLNGTRSA